MNTSEYKIKLEQIRKTLNESVGMLSLDVNTYWDVVLSDLKKELRSLDKTLEKIDKEQS